MCKEQIKRVEIVARALFERDHPGMSWDDVKIPKHEYRIPARTIEAGELCNQSIIDCAKRLAWWWSVDHKVYLDWEGHTQGRRELFTSQALTGYSALRPNNV